MAYFKSIQTEMKVAKIVKTIEAILLLVVTGTLAYHYYIGEGFFNLILATYALYMSYQITKGLQYNVFMSVINVGYTLGLLLYTFVILVMFPIIGGFSLPTTVSSIIFIVIIVLWLLNRYSKKLSDNIFPNVNLIAKICNEASKLNGDELVEYNKKIDVIFKRVSDKLDEMEEESTLEQARLDEMRKKIDETTYKNQTKA